MSDKPAVAGASVGVVTALFAALTGFGLQHLLARTDVDAFERPLSFLVAILLFLRFLTGSANHLWYEHVRESIIDPNKEFGRKEFALDLGFLTVFGCLAAFMCHASIPVCFFGFAFVLVGAAVAWGLLDRGVRKGAARDRWAFWRPLDIWHCVFFALAFVMEYLRANPGSTGADRILHWWWSWAIVLAVSLVILAIDFRKQLGVLAAPENQPSTDDIFRSRVHQIGFVSLLALFAFSVGLLLASPAYVSREAVYLTHRSKVLAVFSFHFDLATGPPKWARGVTLTAGHKTAATELVRSLEACLGESPGSDVVLQIRGFADSNEFAQRGEADLNLQAANKRGNALYEFVEDITEGSRKPPMTEAPRLRIRFERWDTIGEMENARPFRTRPLSSTGAKRDQGRFNRRAEIVLEDAGACETWRNQPTTNQP